MFVKSSAIFLVACVIFTFATADSVNSDSEDCPSVCPALYAPLCASNGKIFKEFDNACQLKDSNCRLERSALQSKFNGNNFYTPPSNNISFLIFRIRGH